MRYSYRLQRLVLNLDRSSLLQLLQISSMPSFRDRIETVRFYSRPDSDQVTHEGYEMCLSRGRDGDSLDEAVNILSQCLRHLEMAKIWQSIELVGEDGHDLVLRAMVHALLSRRVFYLSIDVNRVINMGYGSLTDTPQAYAPYVKGLQIQATSMVDRDQGRRAKRDGNPLGVHIKDFRPTTTELTRFMASFIDVESLHIRGCGDSPRLRICHGCDDLFAKIFAPALYPNLSHLVLSTMYISGSRLRRFTKQHGESIAHVHVQYVTLTDGSWRSVAQGLAKLPNLRELSLESIHQKGRNKTFTRPAQYHNAYSVNWKDRRQVQDFLGIFVEFFSTVQRLNPGRFRESRPRYHEAQLFRLPREQIEIDEEEIA
jgi:hypothetical protein